MSDLLGDGNVKVTFALAVASIGAPTAAELNAGTDLQEVLTKEGLDIKPDQSAVDNTSLASRSETEDAGTTKYEINLTWKKQEDLVDDVAYSALVPGTLGFLAVRRNLPHETAWAATQDVEVYPVRCGAFMRQPPKLNEPQTVEQKMFNHTQPDTEATVAA